MTKPPAKKAAPRALKRTSTSTQSASANESGRHLLRYPPVILKLIANKAKLDGTTVQGLFDLLGYLYLFGELDLDELRARLRAIDPEEQKELIATAMDQATRAQLDGVPVFTVPEPGSAED
ncbi:hypothetical protein ACWDUL_20660 [Nocardia niigatensis]